MNFGVATFLPTANEHYQALNSGRPLPLLHWSLSLAPLLKCSNRHFEILIEVLLPLQEGNSRLAFEYIVLWGEIPTYTVQYVG